MVRTDVGLGVPVIGLGASAPTYYPAVANLLRTTADIPTHAGVANAIGAVVGRIEMTAQAIVSQPAEGRYRAHVDGAPGDFPDAEAAIAFALDRLRAIARRAAADAGAEAIEVKTEREDVVVNVEGRDMFVEARLVAIATGRPRLEMH
jgi:hypothetical protein